MVIIAFPRKNVLKVSNQLQIIRATMITEGLLVQEFKS